MTGIDAHPAVDAGDKRNGDGTGHPLGQEIQEFPDVVSGRVIRLQPPVMN